MMYSVGCRGLVCLLFLLCSYPALAQDGRQDQDTTLVLHSAAFGGERQLRIFTPDRYALDSTQDFAVVYVLDAQSDAVWNLVKGDLAYAVNRNRTLPMMAVGIVSQNRSREFSPKAEQSFQLYRHLYDEVVPLVEAQYRATSLRILVGHSWGGAFIGHTLFSQRRDLFQAYLAISPSLDAYNGMLLHRADSILGATPLSRILVTATGDQGISEMENHRAALVLDSLVQAHPQTGFIWRYRRFEGADHWTCFSPALTLGLAEISRQFLPDASIVRELAEAAPDDLLNALRAFGEDRQHRFGYAYQPSARYWEDLADGFREMGDAGLASTLYAFALEQGSVRRAMILFKRAQAMAELKDGTAYTQALKDADRALEAEKSGMKSSIYASLRKTLDAMQADLDHK